MLCLAFRIRAVQRLSIGNLADLGVAMAHRTLLRDILHAASREILRNLGNNHIRLVHLDLIPNSQFQFFHNADIMDAGPADRGSLQFHWFKDGNRIDQSGP